MVGTSSPATGSPHRAGLRRSGRGITRPPTRASVVDDLDPFLVWVTVAIGGLAAFTAKLVLDYIADLKKQRDTAITGWQGQVGATEKLTAVVHELAKDRGAQ